MLALLALSAPALAACPLDDLAAATLEARDALLDDRASDAASQVDAAQAGLGCLETWIDDPKALSDLLQAGAAAAHALGDSETAVARYADAARLDPGIRFDPLTPGAGPLFDEGVRRARGAPQGAVLAQSDVRLDGWTLRSGEQRAVAPGQHLVQSIDPGGRVSTEAVQVASGEVIQVGAPESRRRGLAIAGASLALGGAAGMGYAGYLSYQAGRYQGVSEEHELVPDSRQTLERLEIYRRLGLYGGGAAVGAGVAMSLGASLTGSGIGVGISGRW